MSKYDKAGLAMIPSGYKASKVYSLIPNSSDGDFDFTRASTATRVNKDGLIDTVASGVPRLEYPLIDGVVQDTPSLLLEPARTNIALYSEEFNNASWSKANLTVTANQAISPDGNVTADEINITSALSHYLFLDVSVTASTNYTFSFYAKKGTATDVSYSVFNETAFSDIISSTSYKNQLSNSEWKRVYVNFTTPVGCTNIRIYPLRDGLTTGTIYIWGAQLEQGSYPTSYIPTSGSTVTRVAETCNGAGTSAEFNDSEGVLFVESSALADDGTTRCISAISDTTATNRVLLFYSSTTNTLTGNVTVGGVAEASIDATIAQVENSKIALKYKENDFELWINGFEVGTDTSGSTFSADTLSELAFDNGGGASTLKGKAKQVISFKEALSDSELEDLTSWDSFNEMATAQEYIIK